MGSLWGDHDERLNFRNVGFLFTSVDGIKVQQEMVTNSKGRAETELLNAELWESLASIRLRFEGDGLWLPCETTKTKTQMSDNLRANSGELHLSYPKVIHWPIAEPFVIHVAVASGAFPRAMHLLDDKGQVLWSEASSGADVQQIEVTQDKRIKVPVSLLKHPGHLTWTLVADGMKYSVRALVKAQVILEAFKEGEGVRFLLFYEKDGSKVTLADETLVMIEDGVPVATTKTDARGTSHHVFGEDAQIKMAVFHSSKPWFSHANVQVQITPGTTHLWVWVFGLVWMALMAAVLMLRKKNPPPVHATVASGNRHDPDASIGIRDQVWNTWSGLAAKAIRAKSRVVTPEDVRKKKSMDDGDELQHRVQHVADEVEAFCYEDPKSAEGESSSNQEMKGEEIIQNLYPTHPPENGQERRQVGP